MSELTDSLIDLLLKIDEYQRQLGKEHELLTQLAASLKQEEEEKLQRKPISKFFLDRQQKGYFVITFQDVFEDEKRFRSYFRMDKATFLYIHEGIHHMIERSTENAISSMERLVVTLRFMLHGLSFIELEQSHRIHNSTISRIVTETLAAIWLVFKNRHLKKPSTHELLESARGIYAETGFPNCPLLLDGKHFKIRNPPGAENKYRATYKAMYSVNLQTLVDFRYKFVLPECGGYGKQHDSNVFANSKLKTLLDSKSFLPGPSPLPMSSTPAPQVILADKGYPLRNDLLTPFRLSYNLGEEQKLFNRKLTSARRIIECAFGQLSAQFRLFHGPIPTSKKTLDLLILTACLLHNLFIDREDRAFYKLKSKILSIYDEQIEEQTTAQCDSQDKNEIRKLFVDYFAYIQVYK